MKNGKLKAKLLILIVSLAACLAFGFACKAPNNPGVNTDDTSNSSEFGSEGTESDGGNESGYSEESSLEESADDSASSGYDTPITPFESSSKGPNDLEFDWNE